MTSSSQPIILQPPAQPTMSQGQSKPRIKYKNVLFKLGIVEVILGSLSVLLCIATLAIARAKRTYSYYDSWEGRTLYYSIDYVINNGGQGIWGGIVLIITGVLGIKAKKHPSGCMYVANMVMTIATAHSSAVMSILSGICAGLVEPMEYAIAYVVLHGIIALIGLIGMIICILHSAYCCAGVCCRKRRYQGVVMYAPQTVVPQQQMVQLANGQYMMVPSASVPQAYPQFQVAGPSFHPSGHVPAQQVPPQQMTKEQEAQMRENPPRYTATPDTFNPSV